MFSELLPYLAYAKRAALKKVQNWRQQHPDGRKIDCERETGLSRHTVLKWWE